MSENEKSEVQGLDISGLLSLKRYERPDSARVEKNIQNTMRTVRTTSNMPSLLLFPDKSFGWMVAQPRYGVAALFIIFLGLHLIDRRIPIASGGPGAIIKAPGAEEIAASVDTNQLKSVTVPGMSSPLSLTGESAPPLSSPLK
ncbi:MAG: hypothetical protein IT583_07220 [Verrucomicrobia bacterium]|nr:hypothetical protein [Verrucomicrobiota bacterium]